MSSNISSNISNISSKDSFMILSPGIQYFAFPKMTDIVEFNFTIQQYNNLIEIANSNNLWQAIDDDSNRNECGWINSMIRICLDFSN